MLAVAVLAVAFISTQKQSNAVALNSQWLASTSVPESSAGAIGLSQQLVVHVVGAVKSPGVYQLETNARVLDAIFAAGGFTPKADQASVNLARPINDGEQIIVLQLDGTGAASVSQGSQLALVNLNQADASQLDSLPGIGPTLAQRIVDYRRLNGGFTSLTDLGKVAGFGPSLIAKLSKLVTF